MFTITSYNKQYSLLYLVLSSKLRFASLRREINYPDKESLLKEKKDIFNKSLYKEGALIVVTGKGSRLF